MKPAALPVMAFLAVSAGPALGVNAAPATQPAALGAQELQKLVAPVALYPDALIAHILPASTAPLDVVQAARYLREHGGKADPLPDKPWHPSVMVLLKFPEVIFRMDKDLEWTAAIGGAVVAQMSDLLNAIQQVRNQAYAAGNLATSDKQVVIVEKEIIKVVPASSTVYVPVYDPQVVLVKQEPSVSPAAAAAVSFGIGMAVGSALADDDCDWWGGCIYHGSYYGTVPNYQAWWDDWVERPWNPLGPKDPRGLYDPRGVFDPRGRLDPRGVFDPRGRYDPRGAYDPRGPSDPRGARDPRGVADPRGAYDPRGVADPRGARDPRGAYDPRGVADPRGASDPRGAYDPRGVADPRGARDPRGASDPRGIADPRGARDPRPAAAPAPLPGAARSGGQQDLSGLTAGRTSTGAYSGSRGSSFGDYRSSSHVSAYSSRGSASRTSAGLSSSAGGSLRGAGAGSRGGGRRR